MTTDLYYQLTGTGPMLLMIEGGAADADHSAALVRELAEHHTVVTYDRRGLSRSAASDGRASTGQPALTAHADDAAQLIAALTGEPVTVLGCSIGALIGLELVVRRPGLVRSLIAHEPPALQLLPESDRAAVLETHREVLVAFREHGSMAAATALVSMVGVRPDDRESDAPPPAPSRWQASNLEHFLRHDFPAVGRHRLDIATLATSPTRIMPAAGVDSAGRVEHRCAAALAQRLDVRLAEFPGGHAGPTTHPRGFAAALRDMLDQATTGRRGRGSLRDQVAVAPDWDSAVTNDNVAEQFESG